MIEKSSKSGGAQTYSGPTRFESGGARAPGDPVAPTLLGLVMKDMVQEIFNSVTCETLSLLLRTAIKNVTFEAFSLHLK